MTQEIEKLYKNAEIKKQTFCSKTDTCYDGRLSECEGCNAYHYPPFTPAKQLELIKWLVINKFISIKSKYKNNLFIVYVECRCFPRNYRPLDEAIADFINMNWQDLSPEEQAEIKDILNR